MKWAKRVQKYVNYETAEQAALSGQFQWIQPKYDGWWACVAIRRGRAYIYSRQGVLKNTIAVRQTDIDCVLIGEYLVGTQRAASIGEAKGQFVAFDMVERHGKPIGDRPYLERSDFAQRFAEHEQWMLPVQNYGIRSHSKVWRDLVEGGDAEGVVFRSLHDTYNDSIIGRVKRTFTMDYVVMGIERGQGRHSSRAGAVICGLYEGRKLVEKVRVGGGWTDAQRDELLAKPKAFIGRVLEVKGWQVFESGSLRHPTAVQWRDDKKPRECVFRK